MKTALTSKHSGYVAKATGSAHAVRVTALQPKAAATSRATARMDAYLASTHKSFASVVERSSKFETSGVLAGPRVRA